MSTTSIPAGDAASAIATEALEGVRQSLANPSPTSRRRGPRVPKQAVAEVTAQLAIMIRSGVDLATALQSLVSQCERPQLAEVLDQVHQGVLSGSRLSEALAQHPRVFDPGYVATIAAAEASGKMADVLAQLAAIQRGEVRLARTIRGLMIYPVLLVVVSMSVIAALVVFVLPRFSAIFEQYDMTLPFMTEALLAVADELRSRWWMWAPLSIGGGLGALLLFQSEAGRRAYDGLVLRTSPFRQVSRPLCTGRLCRLLGLMLQSGVPVLESLRLARDSFANRLYKDLLEDMADAVVNGRGLTPALEGVEIVPDSARQMLATAERSGHLAEVAEMLGDYFEEEAEARMRHLVRALEPAITVGMGAVIAVVVLSVMLPIFDLSSLASGGH